MMLRYVSSAGVVVVVLAYAGFSGAWVSTNGGWYQSLDQPAWQPPPWVFGVIWPYNFLALIVVGLVIAWSAAPVKVGVFLALLALSVVLAVTWAYQFYVPHHLTWAAISLTAAALLTVPITVLAFTERPWLGVLLVPYQVWVLLAASLSWGYVALNSGP